MKIVLLIEASTLPKKWRSSLSMGSMLSRSLCCRTFPLVCRSSSNDGRMVTLYFGPSTWDTRHAAADIRWEKNPQGKGTVGSTAGAQPGDSGKHSWGWTASCAIDHSVALRLKPMECWKKMMCLDVFVRKILRINSCIDKHRAQTSATATNMTNINIHMKISQRKVNSEATDTLVSRVFTHLICTAPLCYHRWSWYWQWGQSD